MGQWFDSTFGQFLIQKMNINTITLLSQLRSASLNNKESVILEINNFTITVLDCLYNEGLILSYTILRKKGFLNNTKTALVHIRYVQGKPVFENLKILSSPSFTRIVSIKNICRLNPKKENFFFSTNKGILSLQECKNKRVGGILLFMC